MQTKMPSNKTSFRISFLIFILPLLASYSLYGQNEVIQSKAYNWNNVEISGGGFVTGIVFHPQESGLRYCRTDMGGAYRWDESKHEWIPLLDWISYDDVNLMGVESIALDSSDPDKIYLACGTYTNQGSPNGAILWSDDRGNTFSRVNLPVKFGANENGRGNGERMAVDPNNGSIIYLGTREDGLWKSTDAGKSWEKVNSFPDINEIIPEIPEGENPWRWRNAHKGNGVIFVHFDPCSLQNGKSTIIYAGVSLMGRKNLFQSIDGGITWETIPGQPTEYRPTHAVLSDDHVLVITYGSNPGPYPMENGGVWKFNTKSKTWTDITPDIPTPDLGRGFGYAAVSVDASNPELLIVSSYNRYEAKGGEEIFLTTDAGKTWIPILQKFSEFDYTIAPYTHHAGVHWMFDIEIDPLDPDHVMFTTGYGGHECFNFSDVKKGRKITWHNMSKGIEETVPLDILSPPAGAQVISALGDYCGFAHHHLDKPVGEGCFENPHFGNTSSVDCAWLKPEIIVRTGISAERKPSANIGYSLDGGATWKPAPGEPAENSRFGTIAVSADGESWIWTPQRKDAYYTNDYGKTWHEIKGLPEYTEVIADRVNPSLFYAIDLENAKFYFSDNVGRSFSSIDLSSQVKIPRRRSNRGDRRGGQDKIYSTPGFEGDIWLAAFDGLYHSTDYGENFNSYPLISEIHAFGFGKHAPGNKYPALFLVGTAGGTRGIFRSDDKGLNWIRINDEKHQWGLILKISGDPKKYGRVYVGTHGRGLIYGDPTNPDFHHNK